MSSHESFDQYREEFASLIQQIERRLLTNEDASDLLEQCKLLLPQLSMEARDVSDAAEKRELLDIVSAYKFQWESYKTQNDRQELMLNGPSNADERQRERMRLPLNQAQRQNETLEETLRRITETEQVARDISQELRNNRETIQHAHGNVNQVSSLAQRARGILTTMLKR